MTIYTQEHLSQAGFPTALANAQQKTEFLNSVMRIKQKPAFKIAIHEFAVLTRGLGEFGSRTNPL